MQFTVDKDALLKALQPVAFSASNVTNPKYKTLMIKLTGDTLEIYSYDLEKALKTTIEVDGAEDGHVEADAQRLCAVVSTMSTGEITFRVDKDFKIYVEGTNTDFTIIGRSGEMFPEIPNIEGEFGYKIPKNKFKSLITKTVFAVSKDETRPVYMGSLFEIENEKLSIVALDGNRAAARIENVVKKGNENDSLSVRFILPGKAQDDILKVLDDSDEELNIAMTRRHIIITFDNIYYSCRLIEGDFMNYKRLVLPENRFELTVDTGEFLESTARCSVLGEKTNLMKVEISGGKFNVSCTSENGTVNDFISCEFEKGEEESLNIGFSYKFVLDALKNCGEDKVHVSLNGAVNPIVITPVDKDGEDKDRFTYLVMPMQLFN